MNKTYQVPETDITFMASGGSVSFTPTSLAAGAGRQSAQKDFGTIARAFRFAWRAWVKAGTTPSVGQVIEIYAKTSDGSHPDNNDGNSDAAVLSSDTLRNLQYIGAIVIDQASTTTEFAASGMVELPHRYFQVVFFNRQSSVALSGTAADHGFKLTPVVDEIQ